MTSWKCRHRSMQPMRIASGGLAVVSSKTGINHARGSGMQIALLHGYKLARTVHRLRMHNPTQRRPLAELKEIHHAAHPGDSKERQQLGNQFINLIHR